MTKKIYSLIAAAAIPAMAMAQPTITTAGDYSIGTVIKNKKCDPAAAGPSGANQTWNFASLTVNDSATAWIIAPFGTNFPTATFVQKNDDSTMIFVNKTSAANFWLGAVDSSSSGAGAVLTFTNTKLNAIRPLTMSTNMSDTYNGSGTIMGLTVTNSGILSAMADAYGTLTLPNGTYTNTIRIKMTENDTFAITGLGTQTETHSIYMWYDNNHASPLLTIDSIVSSSTPDVATTYLESEQVSSTGVDNTELKHLKSVTASINNSSLSIQGLEEGKNYTVALMNLAGQKVFGNELTASGSTASMNLNSELAAGMYLVVLNEKGRAGVNVIKVVK